VKEALKVAYQNEPAVQDSGNDSIHRAWTGPGLVTVQQVEELEDLEDLMKISLRTKINYAYAKKLSFSYIPLSPFIEYDI